MTDPTVDGRADRSPRPHPRSRADLVETPQGWVLTLFLDANAAQRLRGEVGEELSTTRLEPDDFRMTISPNLVPGTPFTISAIDIVVDGPG